MNDNIKRYILVILSAFMCENLFLGVIPSLPTVIIMIFVQILCLRKEDWSLVFLLLGSVLGAYFAQKGIHFVGSCLMLLSSIILLRNMKGQLTIYLNNFTPLYIFLILSLFSIMLTTGGDYSATKYVSMFMGCIIYSIAYLHLMLNYEKHNLLNIGLTILIHSLFMVYYMTELMGSRLTIESFLYSFASFRDELNLYKFENEGVFTINYQSLGMYSCIGLIFSLFSKELNCNKFKVLAVVLSFVVVWYSSARQAFLIFVLIVLSYGVLFKKLNLKYVLLLAIVALGGYFWMAAIDLDSLAFLMGSTEGDGSARDRIMTVAMSQYHSNPLSGVGFGRFYIDNEYGCNEHNLFVELLTEMGLIGLLFFVLPILYSFVISSKYIKQYIREFSLFLCLFLAYFTRSMVSSDLRETIIVLVFALIIKVGSKYKIFGI